MIFFLSPSKTMKLNHLENQPMDSPFVSKSASKKLRSMMRTYSPEALKELYGVSEKVAEQAYNLWRVDETDHAIRLFEGLVFKNLDYLSLSLTDKAFIDERVFIGSALYGIIHANQRILPYRLDLTDPVQFEGESLPQYWTKKVADYFVKHDSAVIVNLASEEYGALLESRKLNDKKTVIKIEFRTLNNGKLINGATHSKMARGQFLRKAAIDDISDIEGLKSVSVMGYFFDESYSDETHFFYVKRA